jgi:hypothetical protein
MNFNAGNISRKFITTTTEIVFLLFDYASITWSQPHYSAIQHLACGGL